MQTFAEWVQENHPDDEVLNEYLGKNARLGLGSALLAATMSLSPSAQGAAPMPANSTGGVPQQQQQQVDDRGYSTVPFSKEKLIEIAEEFGIPMTTPEAIRKMTDEKAYLVLMDRLHRIENQVSRNRLALRRGAIKVDGPTKYPKWYQAIAIYYNPNAHRTADLSTYLPPAPPRQVAGARPMGGIGGGQ